MFEIGGVDMSMADKALVRHYYMHRVLARVKLIECEIPIIAFLMKYKNTVRARHYGES